MCVDVTTTNTTEAFLLTGPGWVTGNKAVVTNLLRANELKPLASGHLEFIALRQPVVQVAQREFRSVSLWCRMTHVSIGLLLLDCVRNE